MTLIEVLFGSAMIGVGAIGLALMLGTGQAFIAGEGDNRAAVYLAQQKMERCRGQGFASPSVPAPSTTTARVDPANADPNLCADDRLPDGSLTTPTDTCDSNTLVCYTRTTAIDCVSSSDYTSTADCTAIPTPPKRITVTVRASPSAGVVNPKTRDVVLRSVLRNPG